MMEREQDGREHEGSLGRKSRRGTGEWRVGAVLGREHRSRVGERRTGGEPEVAHRGGMIQWMKVC